MIASLFRRALAMGVAVFVAVPLTAYAEDFPSHAIEIVVPYAPGGSTDAMARLVAPRLSELLKVPVIVNNRVGAGGAIGTSYGLATNDGYRIVAAGNSNLGPNLVSGIKPNYAIEDASGIARAITNPFVMVTKKGRFADLAAFIREAKSKPDTITYATWGTRSTAHFYAEMLAQSAGIKLRHIPFDSGSKGMLAALGGQVDVAISTVATAKAQIEAGTLTGLLVSTDYKLPTLPQVESIKTLGHPNAVYVSFDGFATSSKVPADRLSILRQAFEKILNDPKLKADFVQGGSEPGYMTGAQYDELLRKNLVTLRNIAATVKIGE